MGAVRRDSKSCSPESQVNEPSMGHTCPRKYRTYSPSYRRGFMASNSQDGQAKKKRKDKFLPIFLFVYVTLLTGGFVYLAFRETALQKELAAFKEGFCTLRCPERPQIWQTFTGDTEGSTMDSSVEEMIHSLNTTSLSAGNWLVALEEKIHFIHVKNTELNMRVNNISLTAGRPGSDGKPGERGPPGEKGERGLPGQKGEEGSGRLVGPAGLPGLQGLTGHPGKDGIKGEPGNPGQDGEKGSVGAPGPSGIPGSQGPNGSKGETGIIGAPGSPGINGKNGQKGEQGLPGQKGDDGSSGEVGPPGPTGPSGRDGVKGEAGQPGQNGQKGAAGSPGIPGNPGLQGARGQEGSKGDNGAQGPPGIPGNKGQKGEEGLKGAMGQKGDVGSAGVNGLPGMKGEPGLGGLPGAKGDTGPSGPPGAPGTPGQNVEHIVRIIGGTKGRVEVKYNGEWGTICDDYWEANDGKVICRMLGYSRVVSTFTAPAGTGKIWLDDVQCSGNEQSILQCTKAEWGTHNCNHNEDAGVECA